MCNTISYYVRLTYIISRYGIVYYRYIDLIIIFIIILHIYIYIYMYISLSLYIYVYIYIYIYVCVYIYIYIYIYICSVAHYIRASWGFARPQRGQVRRGNSSCLNYLTVAYGRFPWFQSSSFQFESLKSEQINCGCFCWHDVGFQCARVSAPKTRWNFGNRP